MVEIATVKDASQWQRASDCHGKRRLAMTTSVLGARDFRTTKGKLQKFDTGVVFMLQLW